MPDRLRKQRAHRIIDTIGLKKKVKLNLVGLDGNAFSLMAAFQSRAKREGWDQDEISYVIEKCMSGNYDNLLCVLMNYCDMDSEDITIDRDEDNMPDVVYVNGVAYRK
jgi:hypothetical protein